MNSVLACSGIVGVCHVRPSIGEDANCALSMEPMILLFISQLDLKEHLL